MQITGIWFLVILEDLQWFWRIFEEIMERRLLAKRVKPPGTTSWMRFSDCHCHGHGQGHGDSHIEKREDPIGRRQWIGKVCTNQMLKNKENGKRGEIGNCMDLFVRVWRVIWCNLREIRGRLIFGKNAVKQHGSGEVRWWGRDEIFEFAICGGLRVFLGSPERWCSKMMKLVWFICRARFPRAKSG
jgi:hypothetical protein